MSMSIYIYVVFLFIVASFIFYMLKCKILVTPKYISHQLIVIACNQYKLQRGLTLQYNLKLWHLI